MQFICQALSLAVIWFKTWDQNNHRYQFMRKQSERKPFVPIYAFVRANGQENS